MLQFYVIYSFDVPADTSVKRYHPPFKSKYFPLTECNESEVFYAEHNEYDDHNAGKHRKYAGILTRKQFDALVDAQDLHMEDIETMGSLTMEFGHLPAMSFNGYGDCAYQNAYVTPFIERKGGCDERDWERTRKAMLAVYS